MMKKVLLFELNEVPLKVIDYYITKYPDSSLAHICQKGQQMETFTSDEGHLHPWATWPTLHRGVDNTVHKIKDFGEDLTELNKQHPPVWKILKDNGISCGVFGSLHSYPPPIDFEDYSFFVPDTFAWGTETHPKIAETFQAFNLAMVSASARNVDAGFNKKDALKLGLNLGRLGIRAKTILSIVNQLMVERIHKWKVTRRRSFQSVMAFDIFLKLLKNTKPQFVTFFSNHVAATMHRYWAATFPEDYEEYHLSDNWKDRYSEEIDFAMHKLDAFLKDILLFIDQNPEYKLIIASSMGQESTTAMEQKSELLAKDLNKFLMSMGFKQNEYSILPAMHPQYNISFHTPEKQQELVEKLNSLFISGESIQSRTKENGFVSFDLGHRNLAEEKAIYQGNKISFADYGLVNEPIQDEASGTAYHIPEGSLLVYDKHIQESSERIKGIDTKCILPSILEHFGIDKKEYMAKQTIKAITLD
ncbi:MAG: hypothetical protein ABJH05_03750 [Fulvivirga sp.]